MKRSTIAAIATPMGRGGVGVVRVSGPRANSIVQALSPGKELPPPRQAVLRNWLDDSGEVLDQGLLIRFPAPDSYTGEDVAELHGHGSPVLMRALLQRIFRLGAQAASPGEFTRRAVENGKMDLSQAEAVAAAIDAATLRAAKLAQRQLHGDFGRRISELMSLLTGHVAHLEACLDFPEDEVPPLFLEELAQAVRAGLLEPLNAMLATAHLGERLFEGATIAFIGAPNVGKSSLLNALAGYERAIVSDMPGTTRDLLEVDFELHGIPVRIVDTAGLRASRDMIEQEGVRRAETAAEHADLVVFVADAIRPETWEAHEKADVLVMNKSDLTEVRAAPGFIVISASTGDGLDQLRDRLARLLGDASFSDESAIVTRERHRQSIETAINQLQAGLSMMNSESEMDLAATEWRAAWTSLGEILGIGDVEHILDRVFSEFCIGK